MKLPHYPRFLFVGILLTLAGLLVVAQMVHIQTSVQAKEVSRLRKDLGICSPHNFPGTWKNL